MHKILCISNVPNYFNITISNKLKEEYDILEATAETNEMSKVPDNIGVWLLFLDKELHLLENITSEQLDFCMSLIDMDDYQLKSLNLSNSDLIKYQKISILYNIKTLYEETVEAINLSKDKKIIEQNKRDLIDFKNSFEFFGKIN